MQVIILGAPGSGKGTQSAEIIKKFKLSHLSTGDMLRAEIAAKTDLGNKAKSIMDAGDLVSDNIILAMVANKLSGSEQGFLFDGFPRTVQQALGLDKILDEANTKISHVIQLEINNEEIVNRMLARGRDDDNEETIRNRLDVYETQTAPLIGYYQDKGILHSVKGSGKVSEITDRIVEILNN